jgi:hypothetical protein
VEDAEGLNIPPLFSYLLTIFEWTAGKLLTPLIRPWYNLHASHSYANHVDKS